MERLILDTGVLVAAERGRLDLARLYGANDDICVAAITAAELLVGVEMADETRRPGRQAFVEGVLALVPVEEYGMDAARAYAEAHRPRPSDRPPRGAHDLVIAATAASTAPRVATLDARARFADLPGVRVADLG